MSASSLGASSGAAKPAACASSLAGTHSEPSASSSSEKPFLQNLRSLGSTSGAEKPAAQMLLSHSVAKPVESSLVAEVRKLGHYPKRHKRPADDAQKAEDSLVKRFCTAWESLHVTPFAFDSKPKKPKKEFKIKEKP